ncbi:LysR family transcriptional regulator [Mesorhizobium koreense]|uniref:LysR family transcriptional regulator n=1 Tax=Mesorhizobium koreense TaxID=3074855 RepID=UPI00287B701B|nr:LysR family transcriptional regulator [Mesorhizobium sp. WR6]
MIHASALRYLIKVAEFGSIRRAAEALNVASSAVNRQVLNVERDIGVRLFDRSAKGMCLTSAGELMLRHARETLVGYQRTLDEIASISGEVRGTVRIIGIGSMIEYAFPRAMETIAHAYPGIDMHVVDANPGDALEQLRAKNFDIGILFLDSRHREFDLQAKVDTSIGAVMRSDHPLAKRKAVTLTECAAHSVAMFSDRWVISPLVETEFPETGAKFAPRLVTNSMSVMLAAIRQGLGIGFFTPVSFIDEIKQGSFVWIPLEASAPPTSGIGLFVSSIASASPPVRVVSDRLSVFFDSMQRELDALPLAGKRA